MKAINNGKHPVNFGLGQLNPGDSIEIDESMVESIVMLPESWKVEVIEEGDDMEEGVQEEPTPFVEDMNEVVEETDFQEEDQDLSE